MDVVEDIQERGLGFPCVVRFQDVLRARVKAINEAFGKAHRRAGLRRALLRRLPDQGEPDARGGRGDPRRRRALPLRPGGRLQGRAAHRARATTPTPRRSPSATATRTRSSCAWRCSGGSSGRKVIVVIEKLSELPQLLRLAEEMGVEPMIGLRSKLTTRGTGKWEGSLGRLRQVRPHHPRAHRGGPHPRGGRQGALRASSSTSTWGQPAHRDPGGEGRGERGGAASTPSSARWGSRIEYFDVGGGLGVDYVGTHSTVHASSMNYTLEEYVGDVVYNVQRICAERGRARAAHRLRVGAGRHRAPLLHHHERLRPHRDRLAPRRSPPPRCRSPTSPRWCGRCGRSWPSLTPRNRAEAYHDAVAKKEEALQMFKLGILGLEERAEVESLFWKLCPRPGGAEPRQEAAAPRHPRPGRQDRRPVHGQLLALPERARPLGLRPALPHRAAAPPRRGAHPDCTIVDITCDSDGKIDRFIEGDGVDETLSLHPLVPGRALLPRACS